MEWLLAYWVLLAAAIFGAAFLVIGILRLIEEIGFRLERRRYRRARM
jgi:hypothetical protein